ncbi:MAG TPA: C39 family peptidase [Methanobacterium sp.]|nr:C39 family peptidase [Methanobacterium sp.]
MKLKFKVLILILLLILVAVPVGINSTILDDNNTTQNSTTLLNVPDVKQPTNSSSGPTSLQAVLVYYGTDVSVSKLINMTNTTENGTLPDNIAQTARELGFTADVKENLTLQDLQNNINQGTPVIILCQAWGNNSTNWANDTEDGHYMVVVGMDEKNIYFEDPAILGSRGYIPREEFLDRWHDLYLNQTGNNTTVNHLGIIVTGGQAANLPPFVKIE